MKIRLLRGSQVGSLLPIRRGIEQMRRAFAELSAGRAVMPPRTRVDAEEGDLLLMPCWLPGAGLCVKTVLTFPENRQRDLPAVQGLALVFDERTGSPRALMDAEELTALRTAAAGGLAIDLLARPESRVVALIGAGVQARRQIEAAMAVRHVAEVRIFDPRRDAAAKLAQTVAAGQPHVATSVAVSAEEAVAPADVVITATTSPVPILDGRSIRPGTHITAIGSYRPDRRELDAGTVQQAYVVVDSREAAAAEAGDLILAGRQPDAELGEVINGKAPGRVGPEQITLFKSVGVAVQDAAAAAWVLAEAERQGVGAMVDL